jgi:hypothetical protein
MRDEILELETLRRDDLKRGGDKGANLGELMAVYDATGYARAIPALLGRKKGRYGILSTTEESSPSIRSMRIYTRPRR